MDRTDLDKKRLLPCMAELYRVAKGPAENLCPQSFEMWEKYAVWGFQSSDQLVTMVPMDCFYLDKDVMHNIIEKWCKGLHGFWYYIPKLDFEDKDYKKKVKELEDFRDFEAKVSADKTLTYAQRAAKIKKEALAHNFRWRSRDKEYISQNIYLGVGPNSSEEWTNRTRMLYQLISEGFENDSIKNLYIPYDRMDTFVCTDKSGRALHATIEKVRYKNTKTDIWVPQEDSREHCNLYDDEGKFVNELWDYNRVRRYMAAQTLKLMTERYKPVIKNKLEELGHQDIVDRMNKQDWWLDSDIAQCFALYIMTSWWRKDK